MPAGNPQGYLNIGKGSNPNPRFENSGPRNAIRSSLSDATRSAPLAPSNPNRISNGPGVVPTNPNRISSGPGIVPSDPRISSGPGLVPRGNTFPRFQPAPIPTGGIQQGNFDNTLNEIVGPTNPQNLTPDRGLANGPQQLPPDFQNILSMILQDPNFLAQIFGNNIRAL